MARSAQHAYDAESGQVYFETSVRINKKQHSDWIGEYKTPSLVRRSRPWWNERGVRSLSEMARSTCVRNLRGMGAGHVRALSWPMAEKVWEEVITTRAESFHAWRIFATGKGSEGFSGPRYRYMLELRSPSLPLADYFKGITSPDLHWLTSLRISPRQINVPDLVAIAKITNLAVLDLSDGQQTTIDGNSALSVLDERIMRTWAELTRTEGAFRHLSFLLLGWQEEIAAWIFPYLDSFPSLRCVVMTDCLGLHQRNRYDWENEASGHNWIGRAGKRSAKSLHPLLQDEGFQFGAVSRCYYHVQDKSELENVPLLECRIGTPRIWAHIVEEFPSTRTVWLDKTTSSSSSDRKLPDVKRLRNAEPASKELRSPPAKKKTQPKLKTTALNGSVADMLADFQTT